MRQEHPSLEDLARGAATILENASDLFMEATLLHEHGAHARALLLHQISLEECAKIDIIGAWATSLLSGVAVDTQALTRGFRSHKAKNFSNAYMLPATPAELEARAAGDWPGSLQAFKEAQKTFHQEANTAKNDALYVNLDSGRFTGPKGAITSPMVERIAGLNADFLARAEVETRMLERWTTSPSTVVYLLAGFHERAEELRAALPNDPEKVAYTLIDELFARAKAGGYKHLASGRLKRSPGD